MDMYPTLRPGEPISVVLTAAEWNSVLAIMDEAPVCHRITDPLMRAIQAQALSAAHPQQSVQLPDHLVRPHA